MTDMDWDVLLAWGLAAFFLFGGVANLTGPTAVVEGFARWGYPRRFHIIAGALEVAVAILLVFAETRTAGALLGGAVMLIAAATVLFHREWTHAIPPLAVLGLTILLLWH